MARTRQRDNEGFAIFADYLVESGLDFEMRSICLYHHVTTRDIYLDTRGPTVLAARLEVWWWLSSILKKSFNEIGRLFHRDPTSVAYALRRLEARSAAMGVPLDGVSHTRDVARAVATGILDKQQSLGQAIAALTNGKKS